MTQVWLVRNSDTDKPWSKDINLFNRFEHIEPSLRISYHKCQDVQIKCTEREARIAVFVVTGKRNGQPFREGVEASCWPVWTEPSHL